MLRYFENRRREFSWHTCKASYRQMSSLELSAIKTHFPAGASNGARWSPRPIANGAPLETVRPPSAPYDIAFLF